MICVVYFLREEETFLHADTEICDPFHLFTITLLSLYMISVINDKLREPERVNIFLPVLHNIIEDQIKKHEKLNSHQFIILCIHQEHSNLRVASI